MRWIAPFLLVLSVGLFPLASADHPLIMLAGQVVCAEDGEVHFLRDCQGDLSRLCQEHPEVCWSPPMPVYETVQAGREAVPVSTYYCEDFRFLVGVLNSIPRMTADAYCGLP